MEKLAQKIYNILDHNRKNPYNLHHDCEYTIKIIERLLKDDKPIKMILPAFHSKSLNSDSVISNMPDAGEVICLETLNSICEDITKLYPHGVELILLHEGHFYTDTPLFSDDFEVDKYLTALRNLIAQYENIQSMDITDFFPESNTYAECREQFINNYLPTTEEIEQLILQNERYKNIYLGYKRLYSLEYKQVLFADIESNREIRRRAKKPALEQLKRYIGFGRLVKEFFAKDDHIKLSVVYKGPDIKDQITINLLPNARTFGTTGFFALLQRPDHHYDFIKKHQAEEMGCSLELYKGYPYYKYGT